MTKKPSRLLSESVIKKIKDGIKDVDEFLTASSGNGSFEGHMAHQFRTDGRVFNTILHFGRAQMTSLCLNS